MPRFIYKAVNSKSHVQEGVVEAQTEKHAINLLHERGFFIIRIKSEKHTVFSKSMVASKISHSDLLHITRQLSTMITAGLTLDESLQILVQQIKKKNIVSLLQVVEDDVKSGKSFSSALDKFPRIFPPVYRALVKAGEASGKLDIILDRLADNMEKNREFNNKIRGALIYPSIVTAGMVAVSIIVMTVVIPRLTTIYREFDVSLPLPTKILIYTSDLLVNSWWFFLIIAFVLFLSYIRMSTTKFGKFILATIVINIPVFGLLIRQSILVEMVRTLSILIEGGVPILVALEISQNATGNVIYREAFQMASKKVEKGFPLSEPFMQNKNLPIILGQMVAIGEHTGKLSESLLKLSKYFETEADTVVRSLTIIIEPLIMITLGIGVAFLVMAVLLPIYSITTKF